MANYNSYTQINAQKLFEGLINRETLNKKVTEFRQLQLYFYFVSMCASEWVKMSFDVQRTNRRPRFSTSCCFVVSGSNQVVITACCSQIVLSRDSKEKPGAQKHVGKELIFQIRLLHHCTLHHHSNVTLHYGISLIGKMSRVGASKHLYEAVNNGT